MVRSRIRLAPEHTTTMDVRYRASAVALGAATFNARVAAAAHGLVGDVHFQPGDEASPLSATVHLAAGDVPELTSDVRRDAAQGDEPAPR